MCPAPNLKKAFGCRPAAVSARHSLAQLARLNAARLSLDWK
jgi:hypothetical protein